MLRFQPAKDAHSIEDFFLGIRFVRPLTPGTFTAVIVHARELATKADLPGEGQEAGLMVAVDPIRGAMQAQQAPGTGGVLFRRYDPAGLVEEELRVDRNLVGYRTGKYQRWEHITRSLEELVLPVASAYLAETPQLESATVQYIDRFLAGPKEKDIDWSELFRADTPWVVSAMRGTKTAWHSHCGRFEATGNSGRRLVNVNVDVGEPVSRPGAPPTWSLAILTLCAHHFSRPGTRPEPVSVDAFPSEMRARFDELHVRAKELLGEVLADSYLKKIGMAKPGT
jgi:uncharacterized protein (TIGR04255 family)